MSHSAGHEEEDADKAALAHGPAIVGLTYRFADPDTEYRFRVSLLPIGRRRLGVLAAVALIVCVTRLLIPLVGLVPDPDLGANLVARYTTILLCVATLVLLPRADTPGRLELLSLAFGVIYIATRCWLLAHMNSGGSAAMILGTVTLLLFGLPLNISIVAPAMMLLSVLLAVMWSVATPAPSEIALFQVGEWLVVVNFVALAILRMMRLTLRQQYALSHALRHLATHDGLTGIANRRHYDQVVERQWARCREEGGALSLVLLDVDFFKLLNDGIGHAAGDECLRNLARLLVRCVDDPACLVARTGGEEFACVLPGVLPGEALKVAACITQALDRTAMPHPHSPIGPHITVSLGVATAWPAHGFTLRDLTGLADRLVYEAKAEGRACLRQHVLGEPAVRGCLVGAETEV